MKKYTLALSLAFIFAASNAHALTFEVNAEDQSLTIRDCGKAESDKQDKWCQSPNQVACGGSFCGKTEDYAGDAAVLERILSSQSFKIIYLNSNGGSVEAGIGIGLALRKATATVVVGQNMQCVSACTIAFTGGLWRNVEDPLSFKVHSASSFSKLENVHGRFEILSKLPKFNGQGSVYEKWKGFSKLEFYLQLRTLSRLLIYFNDMSNPGEQGDSTNLKLERLENLFNAMFYGAPTPVRSGEIERFFYNYVINSTAEIKSAQWIDAVAKNPWALSHGEGASKESNLARRFQLEGNTLEHSLAMRAELDMITTILRDMRTMVDADPEKTYGAGMDKLEAMYSTAITDTFAPSNDILFIRGYTTSAGGSQ